MKSGIYKIHFIKNQKVYIGSSVNLAKRQYEHLRTLRNKTHANRYLQKAYDKYGEKDYVFEIVEECQVEHLRGREQHWIEFYNASRPEFGFNLVSDASMGGTLGYKFSLEQKNSHKKVLEEKVWSKKRKSFEFVNPSGEIVKIFGLRQFCLKNDLPYRTMCNVHRGVGLSCRGWRKYCADGLKKRKGQNHTLIKDGKLIEVNNLKLFCQENGLKYQTIRKGYCNEGWVLAD